LFARYFEWRAAVNDTRGEQELRRELLAGLTGRVVELGAGSGLNFAHYPQTVEHVVAVEPEPHLRERAREAARRAPVVVDLVAAVADALPVRERAFDAAVVAGVLCSVPEPTHALAVLRACLRPGGELRFYEHVRATGVRGRTQDAVDIVWPRLMGGCHPNRTTRATIAAGGFRVTSCRDLVFPPRARISPVASRILGAAAQS